jgi:hypothetical protein
MDGEINMLNQWEFRSGLLARWGVIGALTLGLLTACGGSSNPPDAPAQLQAVPGDAQVTLSWDAASGADSYNVYWSTTAGVTPSTGTKIESATSPYVQTSLDYAATYYYIATAVNNDGESEASAEVSVTLAPAAPATVSALSADGEVIVDWRDVPGATTYDLYWSTDPDVTPATGTKIEDVSAPYVHKGLANGTTYYYVVVANGAGGSSGDSAQTSAVPQVDVPGAPTEVSAILTPETTKSVTLQWSPPAPPTDPADILSYNLYRSTAPDVAADLASADMTEGVVSPHIDLVPAGQVTYYYVVTAVTAGGEGPASAEVSAKPRGSPGTGGGSGKGNGGGGHDAAYGNNLSVPLVFADGVGILGGEITGTDYTDLATGLRPTASDTSDPFPYLNSDDIYSLGGVDHYRQQTSSTWQASWTSAKNGPPQYVELDFGDNLTSAALSQNQVIRVETVLRQYKGGTSWPDTEAMVGYPMALLYGTGATEMQGTTGDEVDATERRVFTVTARLKIQKLVGDVPVDHACGFNGSIAEGLALPDGKAAARYSSEINVGGSQTYGFNWRLNQCGETDKAGTWRITYSFDNQVTVGGAQYGNKTRIESLHPSETKAVVVDDHTAFIDITVK